MQNQHLISEQNKTQWINIIMALFPNMEINITDIIEEAEYYNVSRLTMEFTTTQLKVTSRKTGIWFSFRYNVRKSLIEMYSPEASDIAYASCTSDIGEYIKQTKEDIAYRLSKK